MKIYYFFILLLISDPCCLRPNTVAGYLGENVTISCSYPEEFETNHKLFYKTIHGQHFTDVINSAETQRGRFSMSVNRSSKVIRMWISDVREDDEGVYYCGAAIGGAFISYNSFFTEIQLQVTGKEKSTLAEKAAPASSTTMEKPTAAPYRMTSTAPAAMPSDERSFIEKGKSTTAKETVPASSSTMVKPTAATTTTDEEHFSSPVIIITASVCVALLLIVGSTLIYCKLRHSAFSCNRSGAKNADDVDYENYPDGNQKNISLDPIYENIDFKNSELDLLYESINPIPNKEI
ncbi:hypothetical protein MHYP_G00104760 [Metynnis hypsauchen]